MTTSTTVGTQTTWAIDPAHTEIGFSVKHMMITTVRGAFGAVGGRLELDAADPSASSVSVVIEAASIDTRVEDRDKHLRSADFLNVENHPEIRFESTSVDGAFADPGDRFRVLGELTIRGTTREVELDATYEGRGRDPWGGERVGFTAQTRIDRRHFGLTWNQVLEAGGMLVANELDITLAVQGLLEEGEEA